MRSTNLLAESDEAPGLRSRVSLYTQIKKLRIEGLEIALDKGGIGRLFETKLVFHKLPEEVLSLALLLGG